MLGPLKQEEISGQLHIAELGRVRLLLDTRFQRPERNPEDPWEEESAKMSPTAPYLYYNFLPVQNKQPDIIALSFLL